MTPYAALDVYLRHAGLSMCTCDHCRDLFDDGEHFLAHVPCVPFRVGGAALVPPPGGAPNTPT